MKSYLLLILFLASAHPAVATINLKTNITGQIDVKIADEELFHHSVKCYLTKKGKETHDLGSQVLPLSKEKRSANEVQWISDLAHPFSRRIRTVTLKMDVKKEGQAERVDLSLKDIYGYEHAMFKSTDCGHHNGITRPSQADIEGKIYIEYTVPDKIWAIRVHRTGSGILSKDSMWPLTGILNEDFDKARSSDEILWVKPGSKVVQEIVISKNVSGNTDLGAASLIFAPVIKDQDSNILFQSWVKQLMNIQKRLSTSTNKESIDKLSQHFIFDVLSAIHSIEKYRDDLRTLNSREIEILSNNLFKFANDIHESPRYGMSVKTAAALLSYETAMHLLRDLSAYCDIADVYLPISNRNVKVFGLRAAGFWLMRGFKAVENFSFEPYEVLLVQLLSLEASGLTYSQVATDSAALDKIQNAYDLLTESGITGASPFRVALKNIERTFKQFGSLGTGKIETTQLIAKLTELDKLEADFVITLFESLDNFSNRTNQVVQASVFAKKLAKLKSDRSDITKEIAKSLRLLSVDRVEDADGLMRTMVNLISNQVAIFEKPISDVPYFETLRRTYLEKNDGREIYRKVQSCVKGDF